MEDPTQTYVLLRDWHGGERQALERLLERDLPWVRDYVVKRMGGLLKAKGDLDDYVQEAAIKALKYAPPFLMSDREQFRALLGRITENVLRDSIDKLQAEKRNAVREKRTPTDSMLHLDPPAGHSVTRPSQAAARNEEQLWIRLAIDLLDPEERNLILWREWEGMSFAEMGERLGVAEDAARMRFTRTLPKLARKVKELQQGEVEVGDA